MESNTFPAQNWGILVRVQGNKGGRTYVLNPKTEAKYVGGKNQKHKKESIIPILKMH